MLCKTIILSNSENISNNAPKGILTLSKDNNVVSGKIRLYNLATLPASAKIGLYINEKVHISPLNYKQQCYTFNLENNIDISQSIYCALIDVANNKKVLLEGGSFNGFYFTDSPFDAVIEAKDEQLEQDIASALNDTTCKDCDCAECEYKKYFYDNYTNNKPPQVEPNPINNEHDKNCDTYFNPPIASKLPDNAFIETIQSNIVDKLKNNIVDDFEQYCTQFENDLNKMSQNNCGNNDNAINAPHSQTLTNQPNNDNDIINTSNEHETKENTTAHETENNFNEHQTINNPTKQNAQTQFLNDIVYQLDELFKNNPADDMLNSIIPNSKFVKIENESPYVVGVIYEDKMLKYIAYGVPANYNELPPKDLGQHYQWLPLNPRDVMSDGYFMIFQDALNGNIVEINFEE